MSKQITRSGLRGSKSVLKEAPLTKHVEKHTVKAKKHAVKSSNSAETQNQCVRNQRKCRLLKSPSGQRSHAGSLPDDCPSTDILTLNQTDLAKNTVNHTKTKQHCPPAEKVYIVDTEQGESSKSCFLAAEQTSLFQHAHLFHTPDVAVIDVDNQETSGSPHNLADNTSVSCVFKPYSNSNYEQKSAKYLKSVKYRRKTVDKVNKYASRSLQRNRIKLASNYVEEPTEKIDSLTPEVIIQERSTCHNCHKGTKNKEETKKCHCFGRSDSHEEVSAANVENYPNKECDTAIKKSFCGPITDSAEDTVCMDDSEDNISTSLNKDGSTKESFSESEGIFSDHENKKVTKAAKVHLHPISAELRAKYGLSERDSPDKKGIVERKILFENSREIQGVLNVEEIINDITNVTEDDEKIIDVEKENSSVTERKSDISDFKCSEPKERTRQLSKAKASFKIKELKKTKHKLKITDKKETKPFLYRTSKHKTTSKKDKKSKSLVSSEKLSKKSSQDCDIPSVIQKPVNTESDLCQSNGEGIIDCLDTDQFLSSETVSQHTHLHSMAEETSDSPAVSEDMDTTEVVIAKGAFKMRIKYIDKKKKTEKKLRYKDTCRLKGQKRDNVDEKLHLITKTASNEKTDQTKNGLKDDKALDHKSQRKTFRTKKRDRFNEKKYERKKTSETDIPSKINCLKTVESDKSELRIKKRANHTSDKLSGTSKKKANKKGLSHDKTSKSLKDHVDQVQVTRCEEYDIVVNHFSKPSTGSVSPERIALLKKQLEIKRRHSTAVVDLNKCLSEPCESSVLSQDNDPSSIVCGGLNINGSVTVSNHENAKQKLDRVDSNQENHISQKLNVSIDNQTSEGVHCNLNNTSNVLEIGTKINNMSSENVKASQTLGAAFSIESNDCDNLTNLCMDRNIAFDSSLSESVLVCSQPPIEQRKIQTEDDLKQPSALNELAINQKCEKSYFYLNDGQHDCSVVEGNNSTSATGNKNPQTEIEHSSEEIPEGSNQVDQGTKNLCQKGEQITATKEKPGNGSMNSKDTVVDFEHARNYGLTLSDDSGEEDEYRDDEIEVGPDVYDSSIDKCISLLKGSIHSVGISARTKYDKPLKNEASLTDDIQLSPKLVSLPNDKIVQDTGIENYTSYTTGFDETDSVSVNDTNLVSVSPERKTGVGTCNLSPSNVNVNILESPVYDTVKVLQHELGTDQYDETYLSASSTNESSVLTLPVNYPLAQLFKKKMEAEENQNLIQSKPVDTTTIDNQFEMHQCKSCNRRFRNFTLLEKHQTSSCTLHIEGSLDIEAASTASTNQKLQVLDRTEKNENKETIVLHNRKSSVCSPYWKSTLENVGPEIPESSCEQIAPAEETVVVSSDKIKQSISSDTRKVKKKVKKTEKSDKRERRRSGEISKNVRKDECSDRNILIEENEVVNSDTDFMECPLCREVMRKNDFFCHKLSCLPSPQTQNTGLNDLIGESNAGQIESITSSLNQESTEGSSKVPFTNHGSHLSESDSLSDTSHASRSDLKIVLTKVKMCNLIMNGKTLQFCGSVNKPSWKIKDTKKKKVKGKSLSVSKIIEEDDCSLERPKAVSVSKIIEEDDCKLERPKAVSVSKIMEDDDCKLERPESESFGMEMELATGLNSSTCDNSKTEIQQHETCKTPAKDKCENQDLKMQDTSQKTVKKANTKKSVKLKENSLGPDKSSNLCITDFEKQLLVIDHSKIRVKERTKKKNKVQSSMRKKIKEKLEVTDKSLVKLVKEPPEHFMRSKIAQKIYERDKAQVHDDGLPDFSKYGGHLETLPPLVVERSVSEINNNMCKSKESKSSDDLISIAGRKSNILQKEVKETMETVGNVPKEKLKHSDEMDDHRNIAEVRTYGITGPVPFYSQHKMPKFEFSTARFTDSVSPVAIYSSDNLSSNELDNTSDNLNSSQAVSESSEISSIEDTDSFTMTDLQAKDHSVIGNSTPSSTANVYGGGTASRSINCSSFYINQDPWHSFIDSHKQETPQNSFSHWQNFTVQKKALSSTPFVENKLKASENLGDIFELSGISSIHEKSETPPRKQRIKRYEISDENQQNKISDGDRRVVVCRDRGLSSFQKKVEDQSTEKQSQEVSKRKSWRKKQTRSTTVDNTISTRKERDRDIVEVANYKGKLVPEMVSDHGNREKVTPFVEKEKVSSYNKIKVSTPNNESNLVSTLNEKEKVCTFDKEKEVSPIDNKEDVSSVIDDDKVSYNEEKETEMSQTDDCDTNHEIETNHIESEPDMIGENTLQDHNSLHSKDDNDVDDDLVDTESIEDTLQETHEVRNTLDSDRDKESENKSGIDSDVESNDKNIDEKEADVMSEESMGPPEDVEAISEGKTAKQVTQFELKEITDDVLYLSDPDMDMFLEEECQFNEDRNSSREQSPIGDNLTTRENHSNDRNERIGSVGRQSCDRDSLDSEGVIERDRTKSDGIRRLRWMPRGYCFNYFNNRRCAKNPCTYQHNHPPPNVLVQSFKEHLDRNDDEICLDILRSHGHIYGNIPNLHLETLYRRLCSNVESFWLLKIMNCKGMLDQIIVDNYIRNFAHIKYADYLYDVFEMAKANNIQLQEDVVLKLLTVFSIQEPLLEKLIAIMIYSTEDENFLVPVEYVRVAVNGVLKMPKLSSQLLPWLLNTKQLLQLHSDVVERLCEELEKNGVRKNITTKIKDVLKQLKKGEETSEQMMEEPLWTEEDERLWKDNVKSVKYTKNYQHLAELYDEKMTRDRKLTKEECGLYITVFGEDQSKADKAFCVFLENVTCKSSSLRGSPVVFRDPLAAIAYGVFELCYNNQSLPVCEGILATMRDHGVALSTDQFALRAVKVHISMGQSQLVLDIVKDVNFDTMDWRTQEEFIKCFHDLVGQLGQQGCIMECLTVVQWAFKLVYNGAPNVTERESFINLPEICNGLINVFLNENYFDLAVTVYGLVQQFGQHFPGIAQLEQTLMVRLFETECKHVALNIYEKLKRLKFYKQQEFNTPRKIAIPYHKFINLGIELVIIVEDYLMDLYNLLCGNVLANQHPSHRDLHLKIVFLPSTNQISLLKDAKTVLETKLNPPLQSSIEYGQIVVVPESLQNYLTQLDKKGRGQGLKFDAIPGSRNFQHTRKQRR